MADEYIIIFLFCGGIFGYVIGFFVAMLIYRSPTWPN